MPKTRPPYLPEFRRQMVDLVRAGRSPEDLSREFEPTAQSIGAWAAAADKQNRLPIKLRAFVDFVVPRLRDRLAAIAL